MPMECLSVSFGDRRRRSLAGERTRGDIIIYAASVPEALSLSLSLSLSLVFEATQKTSRMYVNHETREGNVNESARLVKLVNVFVTRNEKKERRGEGEVFDKFPAKRSGGDSRRINGECIEIIDELVPLKRE